MTGRHAEWRALVLWVVVVHAAAPLRAQVVRDDLIGRPVVAVDFDCAAPIDVPGLRRLLPLQVGEPLRARDLDEARWRLAETELFNHIDLELEPRQGGVAVIVQLLRKPIVNRLRFEGNHTLGDRDLVRNVRLRESMPLSDELREYAVDRLLQRYAAEGFDEARITADVVTRAPGEVDVVFRIDEGQPLRVGALEISGEPLSIAPEDIKDAIHTRVGDRYVREQRRTAEKAVVALLRKARYYEAEVDGSWEPGPDKKGTLRFHIDAGPRFTIAFEGNHHFSDSHLLDLMDLPRRPIVTDGTWRELARRAESAYHDDGYYFAQIELAIEPGPPKIVRFTVHEGGNFRVAAVHFIGNRGLSSSELLVPMATRPPSWIPWRRGILTSERLDDDLKRLWFVYRKHGFESAQIVDVRTEFDKQAGTVVVTIIVEEGPQTIVRAVVPSGLEPIAKTIPEFVVRVDQPLDRDALETDRQAILNALAQAGYTRARVRVDVTTEPGVPSVAATVHYEATAGTRQFVGTIIVQNDFDTHTSVIVRELPFKEGSPLDPSALLRGQGNIYKLGLFRSVTVRPLEEGEPRPVPLAVEELGQPRSPADVLRGQGSNPTQVAVPSESPLPSVVVSVTPTPLITPAMPKRPAAEIPNRHPIAVTVAEKPPGSLQWGVGYNTRDGFRGFSEISHGNLQGLARRLSLRGEINLDPSTFSPNEYLANLGFREPRLGETKWTFRTNLIAQRSTRHVDQFSLERFALIPAIERYFLPDLEAGVDLQIEQAQVFDLNSDVRAFNPRDEGRLRSISFGPFMVYDGRDDVFSPHRGVFDSVRLRLAPNGLADIPFVKFLGQHTQYIPLGSDVAIVYVMRSGWARTLDGGEIVPIRERLFLGGRTTVRGFSENDIGPKGSDHNPLGGDLTLNLNAELHFPLLYGFGGVLFADGGGVYFLRPGDGMMFDQSPRSISIRDFRRSAGLGIRYVTPIGPVSLDYGFKLDRRAGESVGEVHFSIGSIF